MRVTPAELGHCVRNQQRSPNGGRPLTKFFFSTPVWGAGHLDLFLRIGLPSLLAPGNLPGLSRPAQHRYFVYTRARDERRLRSASAFQRLCGLMPVEVVLVPEPIIIPHRTMSEAHMDTMHRADRNRAAGVFLPPDCVWSDGSMVRLQEIARSGKSVVHMSGIRLDRDAVVPRLTPHLSPDGKALSIQSRSLVKIGLQHLHPIALSHFWDEHGGDLMPANLLWTVPGEGLLLRCFHLHPLMVKSQRPFANFASTIDDDLPLHACPDEDGDYVVTDSDELLAFEMSGRDRVVGTVCAKGSIEGVARWAEVGTNKRHRALIRHAIRLHSVPMTEAAWAKRERASGLVADAVVRLNTARPQELVTTHPLVLRARLGAVFRRALHSPAGRVATAWALRTKMRLMRMNTALYAFLFLRAGSLRMTHPGWLVRRSALSSILSCLAAGDRRVALIGPGSPFAAAIEDARPGLMVSVCPWPAAANILGGSAGLGMGIDTVIALDLDAGAEDVSALLTRLSKAGSRCFWLRAEPAAHPNSYGCPSRCIGGIGTRFVNRARRGVAVAAGTLAAHANQSIWAARHSLSLSALLLTPLVYLGGAVAGLLLNLFGVALDRLQLGAGMHAGEGHARSG